MIRTRFFGAFGASVLVALAACNNDTTDDGGSSSSDLTGTWTITKYEFVSVAHPTTKVDVIATGYTGSVVLSDAAKTWTVTILNGSSVVSQASGTYSQTANTLTFSQSGQSASVFNYTRSGNTVTLTNGTNYTYDFGNGDEAATANITFTKTD